MIGAVGLVVILVAIVVGSIVERRRVETEEALVRLASSVARTDEMKQFVEAVIRSRSARRNRHGIRTSATTSG